MDFKGQLLASILVIAAAPAVAEVYRHVDSEGNVTFSDEPQDGAEEIEVKPVTTVTLPRPEDVREPPPEVRENADGQPYDNVSFSHPTHNDAFHSGNGNVEFQVSSTPALREGHLFEITLDGQPVGQDSSGDILVRNIDRGTHQAAVHIINQSGQRIQSGDPVTFTLHRPSVIQRNNN